MFCIPDITPSPKLGPQFHAKACNLANRAPFGFPNYNLNSGQIGVITSQADTPQQIQFGLKVIF